MGSVAPLAMSQTKDDLLRHLDMDPETYAFMAKETDTVYEWLTTDKRHLKSNCKRKPPYDWSDIVEKSKDEAMTIIASSGNEHTSYYWNLAAPSNDCPNWIARWFLYHKFRYRDGRNRNPDKSDQRHQHKHHRSSKHSHHDHHDHHPPAESSSSTYSDERSYSTSQQYANKYPDQPAYNCPLSADRSQYDAPGYENQPYLYGQGNEYDAQDAKVYYDPVRDVKRY